MSDNISLETFCSFSPKDQAHYINSIPQTKEINSNGSIFNVPIKSNQQILNDIKFLIDEKPDNWVRLLKSKKYNCICRGYVDWISLNTPLLSDKKYTLPTKVYWILNNLKDFPKCKNNNCKYKKILDRNVVSVKSGYSSGYCCPNCSQSSVEHQDKMHKLALQKYGTDFIQNSPKRLKTIKDTLKKREQEDPEYWEKRNQKSRKTFILKYGVDNPNKVPEIHSRILQSFKQTCLNKYGVQSPFHSKEIREKIVQTNIEKYGVKTPFQNKELQEKCEKLAWSKDSIDKRISTLIKKYNSINAYQIEEVYKNAQKSIIERFFKYQDRSTISFNFTIDEYLKLALNHQQKETILSFHCKECGKDFLAKPFEHYYNYSCARCLDCHPLIQNGVSLEETDVLNFVKECIKDVEIIHNDRKMIKNPNTGYPLELDIWIPTLKKAIEFNGDYWHSQTDRILMDQIKKQQCIEKEIELMVITENEWLSNQDLVKEHIKEFLK